MFRFLGQEPLLVFIVVASVLFMADRSLNGEDKPEIKLTPTTRLAVLGNEKNLKGSELSEEEKSQAIEDYIDEEVLLKEAYRLGLDNDQIIRTRMLRKLKFLYTAELTAPSEKQLMSYYLSHKHEYIKPNTRDIAQVFFSIQTPPITNLLEKLNTGTDYFKLGDDHPRFQRNMQAISQQEVMARFGRNVFDALASDTSGKWIGPIESPYGSHFIRVLAVNSGPLAPYDEIKSYVKNTWIETERNKALDAKKLALRNHYDIYLDEAG